MKYRNLLLASSAVAVVAAVGQAQADPFYISVLGGVNWAEDQRVFTTNSTLAHFDFDTGFVLGGAFGIHFDRWLRGLSVELEAAYRHNDLDGRWISSSSESGAIKGTLSNFSLMANAWYEIDVGSKVRPYLGGGVGWARAHLDQAWFSSNGSSVSFTTVNESSGFAFQLGVGALYEIMHGVDVGIGYRYFDGPNISAYNGCCGQDKIDNVNHSVIVNLNIDID